MLEAHPHLLLSAFIMMAIAAALTTAFPIAYSFFPWWKSITGRALMTRSIAYAALIDATLFLQLVPIRNPEVVLWANIVLFGFLAYGSASTLAMLFRKYPTIVTETSKERHEEQRDFAE